MSTAVVWSKSKPDVEFQYGGRLGKFHGMSSQSLLPHCRVLPPGKFNVMIPELCVTLQGAATWWIHCHDSRATCHIAGCSHLAKSMSWLCHIAGCNNFICHIENRFLPFFTIFSFFNAVWGLTSGGFRVVSNTLVCNVLIIPLTFQALSTLNSIYYQPLLRLNQQAWDRGEMNAPCCNIEREKGMLISSLRSTKVPSQSTFGFAFFIPFDRSRRARQACDVSFF